MIKEKNKKGIHIFPMIRKSHSEKITLNDLWKGDELPLSLKSSLAFIYCFHLRTVNVFRRNGNEIAHESLCNSLKKNMNTQPLLSIPMVYDVCSAIKAYVRDIPNGLMGKKLLKEWHRIARVNNPESLKKKLKSIVQKLPPANRNLLFHFLVLVSAIIDNQTENAMSSKSLSIVLLPSFFEKVVNFTNIKELPYFVEMLEIMILNSKYLIEPDVFASIAKGFNELGSKLVIQSHQIPDDKPFTDTKLFLSQDSGLNSTSFLDDKGSQSLSGSSQARVNYQDNGNSMEDLLNESDCINTTSISNNSEDNIMNKSDSAFSMSSSISSPNDDDNFPPTVSPCRRRCNNQHSETNYSCIGTQVHNINECRPHTIYGSPSLYHSKWEESEYRSQCYTPVYDRSFFNIDCSPKIQESSDKKEAQKTEPKTYFIQRRKPITKKTSEMCSSTVTIMAPSVTSDLISCNESFDNSNHSARSSASSSFSNKHILIRYKQKRNFKTPRNRYTAPIHPSEVEIEVWPPCLHRATSMNQSSSTIIDE